jgi:hypothetical protein
VLTAAREAAARTNNALNVAGAAVATGASANSTQCDCKWNGENAVKKFIDLRLTIGAFLFAAILAFVGQWAFALNFWISFAIAAAAILIVGLSAVFVDE